MEQKERALLVGVNTKEDQEFEYSMEELAGLASACQMEVVGIITQNMDRPNQAIYIGSGKVAEVKDMAGLLEADIIVFNNALSPSQLRNLQKELSIPIVDRTTLILDIFERRAKSREAKLQVESARLQYFLPRLVGLHDALSRQGGTSGSMSSRGAGEKKLELDRRKIEKRISELRRELEAVSQERETQRKKRVNARVPQVSLVGYTNAGKSTIMNAMLEEYNQEDEDAKELKKVLAEDMLFATLDTSVRLITAGNNQDFLLTDTVGFIHKLPHGLVKAFRSTLEEIRNADLLLHIIDYSDPHYKEHMAVTRETLQELDAANIPVIYVYNKSDLCDIQIPSMKNNESIYLSAKQHQGITELKDMIIEYVYQEYREVSLLIPYEEGRIVSYFMETANILEKEYRETGIYLKARCHQADAVKYSKYRDEL